MPTTNAPTITPSRPTTDTSEAVLGVRPHALSANRDGSTTPNTTRSKPSNATASQHSGATQPAYRSRGFTHIHGHRTLH